MANTDGTVGAMGIDMERGLVTSPSPTVLTKDIAVEIRMGFVRKVDGILSCQLLLTVLIAAPIATASEGWPLQAFG
eukprot:2716813-Amphidinium_carterae.1